jgi:hypothetical protein
MSFLVVYILIGILATIYIINQSVIVLLLFATSALHLFDIMAPNKKRKHVRAIDSYEFETFVRTHLSADLADIILLTIGIKSYNGFVQSHDFNAELLDVYDSLNEKDKLNLFLYHNASSTTRVKPAILRELKIFQDECLKRIDNDKNNAIGSGADLFNKN